MLHLPPQRQPEQRICCSVLCRCIMSEPGDLAAVLSEQRKPDMVRCIRRYRRELLNSAVRPVEVTDGEMTCPRMCCLTETRPLSVLPG
jgi:hypothetical protein